MAQWIKNPTSIHEEADSIPGHKVKDLVLLKLWLRSGIGVGWQLWLQLDPEPGNLQMQQVQP